MQLYDPTPSGAERNLFRAAALVSLEGRRIGILENGKLNAVEILHEVADLFVKRNGCVIGAVYSKSNASAPAPSETLAQAAAEVDFLITGLGDRGSCSTCSLHDGITFEQLGKRAVVLTTEPFEVTAKNIASPSSQIRPSEGSFLTIRRVRGAQLLARRRRIVRTPTIKLVPGARILARPRVRRGGASP